MKKKAILAYSGGLDTSFCAVYLSRDLDLEVHTVIVNSGGFSAEELAAIEQRAYELGSVKHEVIDVTTRFYQDCLRYLLFGNVLKNDTYPLSVSAERMFQSLAIAEYARANEADYIVHGSTGAGNDQVRFDAAHAGAPDAFIDGVAGLIPAHFETLLLQVFNLGLARQFQVADGREDFRFGRDDRESHVKTHLVVAGPGAAVHDVVGLVGAGVLGNGQRLEHALGAYR